jgi:hypothetical protein
MSGKPSHYEDNNRPFPPPHPKASAFDIPALWRTRHFTFIILNIEKSNAVVVGKEGGRTFTKYFKTTSPNCFLTPFT